MTNEILDALRRGAVDDATTLARAAVEAAPGEAAVHRAMALVHQARSDNDAALASIDRALALSADDADLHFLRAGILIAQRELRDASRSLSQSVSLDPNHFAAYVMQAQVLLGAGDIEGAERNVRLAERVARAHPWIDATDSMIALRRGDAKRALALATRAAATAPGDPQILHALGFAHMGNGHWTFAEQVFRRVQDASGRTASLTPLIADLLARQGQLAEAAETLAPLLADPAHASPGVRRQAALLDLDLGNLDRAMPALRALLGEFPSDRVTIAAVVEAWERAGAFDDARNLFEAALATVPGEAALWEARLRFEPIGDPSGLRVVERWLAAQPDHPVALVAKMDAHDALGQPADALATARRVQALQPGNARAEQRILEDLVVNDPAQAVERIPALRAGAPDPASQAYLSHMLGRAFDAQGRSADAVAQWSTVAALQRRLWPAPTAAEQAWPDRVAPRADVRPFLLWGGPGSGVARIAALLQAAGLPLFADRMGATAPDDVLMHPGTPTSIVDGALTADAVMDSWGRTLPLQALPDGVLIDWLLWWDNALLHVLRTRLPEATLLVALRDPRDMLLDWLAFGSSGQWQMATPDAGATALARMLEHIAVLHEQDLMPHRLVRLDGIESNTDAVRAALADATGLAIGPTPPLVPDRFAAGHWRRYADALSTAFARLTPVAVRLGYPES